MEPTVATVIHNQLWYLLPLLVAICLVYGATRHELMGPILVHAVRFGTWIIGFMAVLFVLLCLMSWNL
jgi:hypothetical protein